MVDYNIVKFCRFCRTRFVVPKGQSMRYLCKACEAKEKPRTEYKPFKKAKKPSKK